MNTFFAANFRINLPKTGANINRLRIERGYSVTDLQEKFNFSSPQAIYKWLRGSCLPTIENLYVLSVLFGVTLNDLVVVDGPKKGTPGENPGVPFFVRNLTVKLKQYSFFISCKQDLLTIQLVRFDKKR